MKKLAVLLLVGVMAFSSVACGNSGETGKNTQQNSQGTNNKAEQKVEVKNTTDLLTKVWETYGEDEKFYGIGGDYNNVVENAPGKFDIADTESLEQRLCFPEDAVSYIDEASSLFHGMMANNFSCGAYHVKEKANMQMVVEQIKERTLNNQWMCGFPQNLVIITVGDEYVVSAFGSTDIIENFKVKLTDVYGDTAKVAVDLSLAE